MIFQNSLKFHSPNGITISKYHLWYLSQISLQIMLLPILVEQCNRTVSAIVGGHLNWSLRLIFKNSRNIPCSNFVRGAQNIINFVIDMINWQQNFVSSNSVYHHTRVTHIKLPLRGRPILLITRMITDRTGLHSFLLPLF